jgi:hypothetical protein
MWLPKPVYERIPQFYFLVGLLFMANGLYLGFDFVLAFYYIGFGLISCSYGVAIFLMRLQNRHQAQPIVQATAHAGNMPASAEEASEQADESVADSSHEPSAQH